MNESPLYHVVKITSSGLGDAIKAVLAGALYCEVSKRTLIVDWRKSRYSNASENTFYHLFGLQNIPNIREIPNNKAVAPRAWQDRIQQSMHEVYTQDRRGLWNREEAINAYSIDFDKIDYPENITVSWDFDQVAKLLPHFPDYCATPELYRYAAKKFITVDASIHNTVAKITEQLPKSYLAAHIRATKEFDHNKGRVPFRRYLDLISDKLSNSQQAFFLASDNIDVQKTLTSTYPNLITFDKWFAPSGEALHLSSVCPDNLQNAKSALVDIMLLANSRALICNPNSCFSECAQYFSPLADQKMISALPAKTLKNRIGQLVRRLRLINQ